MSPCPCHSHLSYETCCRPYHGGLAPPTALALMRSRYAAYAKNLPDYIQKTTHPKSPHFESDASKWRAAIKEFSKTTEFVGLEILGYGDDWVYFAARLKSGGKPLTLLEKSKFEQVNGRWLYLSGEVSVERP